MLSRIWFSPFWQPVWITTALHQTQPFLLQHQCSPLLNSMWFSKPWQNQAISSLTEGWDRLCMSVGKLIGQGSSWGSPRPVQGTNPGPQTCRPHWGLLQDNRRMAEDRVVDFGRRYSKPRGISFEKWAAKPFLARASPSPCSTTRSRHIQHVQMPAQILP